MNSPVLNQLHELRPETGIKVLGDMKGLRLYLRDTGRTPLLLINPKIVSGQVVYEPAISLDNLAVKESRVAQRKAMTLPNVVEDNYTFMLNNSLSGGRDYPLLTSVAGFGMGLLSGAAGLIFSAAATGVSLGKTTHRILARGGDELWQMEEIGKSKKGGSYVPVHVLSYFLVDPFRGAHNRKVWLIHEERQELVL